MEKNLIMNSVTVFLGKNNYCTEIEELGQVILDENEQQAVIGFISLMKKASGKKIQIVENTIVDAIILYSKNSNWSNIEDAIKNYKEEAQMRENDIKDKLSE